MFVSTLFYQINKTIASWGRLRDFFFFQSASSSGERQDYISLTHFHTLGQIGDHLPVKRHNRSAVMASGHGRGWRL